jgi:signal transduction histidine kinase
MNIFEIIVSIALLFDIVLGAVVLKTNPARTVNRAYAILCAALGAWLISVGFVLHSQSPESAELGIRIASVASCLFFNTCHLLRECIRTKCSGIWASLRAIKWYFLVWLIFCALFMTDFFLESVTLPQATNDLRVAEPNYGPGFLLMNAYFLLLIISLVIGLTIDIKQATGIQRMELQYVAMGSAFVSAIGGTVAIVIPLLSHSSQTAPLAPLGVIIFSGIVAYGIARNRIMDVSSVVQRSVSVAIMAVFGCVVYFISWIALDWLLTISCGFPDSIAYLASSMISMAAISAVRPRIKSWVNQVLFEKEGICVDKSLEKIARDLQNVTTLDHLLDQFMALAPPVVGASRSAIFISEKNEFKWAAGDQAEDVQDDLDPVIDLIKKERIPLVLEQVERQQQTEARKGFCDRMRQFKSHAAIGIFSFRKLEGILFLGPHSAGKIYSYLELDSLQLLCNQLAVLLENASLYTEVQTAKIYNEILLDQLVTGVVAADAGGNITFFNREAQRITSQPDLKNQPISMLPDILQDYWYQAVKNGKEIRDQDIKIAVNGDAQIPARLSASAFRSAQGEVLGALVVFNDMTAIKALESKIRRADRLMSVGTLAAGMAHEIKNPLVSIKTFAQLLPERYEDSDFRTTFSELMGQEVDRIDGIVNQLLRFARPQRPRLEPLRIHEVLEESVQLIQEQLKKRNLTTKMSLSASDDVIQGDANQLHQVFVNFYLNAIEAMASGGILTIGTHNVAREYLLDAPAQNFSWIQIKISDTGKGIDRDELQKIFDPFYTSKSEGTGLGLSVAYNIVQEHGGSIDVESVPTQGTEFVILLPVSQEGIAQ